MHLATSSFAAKDALIRAAVNSNVMRRESTNRCSTFAVQVYEVICVNLSSLNIVVGQGVSEEVKENVLFILRRGGREGLELL